MSKLQVRSAIPADWPTITDFNNRLAIETEDIQLDPDTLRQGVRAILSDSTRGQYFVACHQEQIVGQLLHTREWSDWRNGEIWWLQSVYVTADFRRQGVFRMLYEHARREAIAAKTVVGIRLYVDRDNAPAHATYHRLGMEKAGYFVMQEMFADRCV